MIKWDYLKDKKILITGASKGLGREAALGFAEQGSKVALVARSEDLLNDLLNTIDNDLDNIVYAIDLFKFSNIKFMIKDIIKKWKGIDIIIHCIGGSMGKNEILETWDNFEISLRGNLGIANEINRLMIETMINQKYGNIIHIGSNVSFEDLGSVPYNSAKACLSGYIKSLGRKLIHHGIIVSGILPGAFYGYQNAMWRFEYYKKSEYEKYKNSLPQKRMPQASEFLPMLFLLSNPQSKVMSGSLVLMDGGKSNSFNYNPI